MKWRHLSACFFYSLNTLQTPSSGANAARSTSYQGCCIPEPRQAELRLEHKLSRVAILQGLAVHAALDSDIVRVDRVLGHNGRADRGVVVESLSEQPLATVLLELPVTGRNIVRDSV